MLARNYFGVGFLRGLNSVAEVFAPHSGGCETSLVDQMRSDWIRLGDDLICAHWSGPLPPPAELEKIDEIIPGGADRAVAGIGSLGGDSGSGYRAGADSRAKGDERKTGNSLVLIT